MKSLFTLFTAILVLLGGTTSLCAQERVADAERAADSKEAVYQQLKLRVPGKVEAILLYREKQRIVVNLYLTSYLLGTPEPQLPEIEVWLLKPDGIVLPHSEKPKRVVSSHNGYAEPILCYAFPNIEKSDPVALVMKVDGEFFVEKLAPSQNVREWMYLMGEKLDCHFTFERYRTSSSPSKIEHLNFTLMKDASTVITVESLVERLSRELERCRVFQDDEKPNIIHIIDELVFEIPDYSLNKRVDLNYSGVLGVGIGDGLAVELSKQIPQLGPWAGGNWRESFDDTVTQVDIHAKNREVRKILSEGLPLKGYSVFLWLVHTRKDNDSYKTTVQFYGPKPKVEEVKSVP